MSPATVGTRSGDPVRPSVILEYWIPAEGLDEFNRNIVGEIWVVDRFSAGDTAS